MGVKRRNGDGARDLLLSPRPPVPPSPRLPIPGSPVSPTWRTFCAIELPEQVRAQLQDHVRRLREAVPDASASWSRPENVHLTLKFFGNVSKEKLPRISEAAERTARELTSFSIRIGGTGAFRAQVLWIGVEDPSGQLTALQRRFDEECAREGFAKEDRAYKPHLTLARLRRPEGARKLAGAHLQIKFAFTEISVNEFVVFRSQLSPKGSIYTPISKHELSR
ncbi:MAG TPA: RNA 2',3'-cyclic phosphodiesterase [Pyrinomonadaceae bacterium]|nr:RNA 2',3'-cyclic phosphodiesterase [Pyrinomonadaceae bacterium]